MKLAQQGTRMWAYGAPWGAAIFGRAAIATGLLASSLLAPSRLAADEPAVPAAAEQPTTAPAEQPTTAPSDQLLTKGLNSEGAVALTANKTVLLHTRFPLKLVLPAQPEIADAQVDKRLGPDKVLVTGHKPGNTHITFVGAGPDGDVSQTVNIQVAPDLGSLPDDVKKLFPDAKVEVGAANGTVLLRGHVPDLKTADQIVSLATPYGAKDAGVINLMEISGGQQVVLQVRFAEVSRSVTTNLGFNAFATDGIFHLGYNNGPGGSPIGALATGATVSISPAANLYGSARFGKTAFEQFVQALRQNNLMRILAEPNLTTMSGHSASFLAGGEIPILVPQPGSGGATIFSIEYKPFGVQLNFTPVVLGDGHVRLDVAPEVSELDFTHAVTVIAGSSPVPGLTKRNLHTVIELNEGQTFAIGGLLNNQVTATKSVTPLLGDLPILGALFRSVQYERDETELVVLVTPHLAGGMDPNQVPKLPGELWRYPTEAELFLNQDLGGPATDTRNAPNTRSADYRGLHGFAPADTGGSR